MPDEFHEVETTDILEDRNQPRQVFDPAMIARLKASILARGLLTPLRVTRDETRGCWLVISGESRLRAAREAGLKTVPCVVVPAGKLDECDLLADRLVENQCRQDLSDLEFSRAVAKLQKLRGCTASQLAEELGFSNATLSRAMALLVLPAEIQQLVEAGRLAATTAVDIGRVQDEKAQLELAREAAANGLSRHAVAERVHELVPRKNLPPSTSRLGVKFDGISVRFNAAEALNLDVLCAALARLLKEARRLKEGGEDVSALATAFKAS